MGFLESGVFWTAVVGLAGILGTFLAPAWAQRKIERRREARAFRRARRLVAHELDHGADMLELAGAIGKVPPMEALESDFRRDAWAHEQGELSAAVDDDVWDVVQLSYTEFEQALGTLRMRAITVAGAAQMASADLPDLPDQLREQFPVTADRMRIAREMLLAAEPLAD